MKKSIVVIGIALTWIGSREAAAQISPGPLAEAHRALDQADQCGACHGARRGEEIDGLCRSCHATIDLQVSRATGLHGRESWSTCTRCHPDHGGRDFELIEWPSGRDDFAHGRTGWQLEGAHSTVDCRSCHKPEFQSDSATVRRRKVDDSRSWLGLEQRCAACHDDIHRQSPSGACSDCHDVNGWKPAGGFDHGRTDYPLTGRHEPLECSACHEPAESRVFGPLAHAECSACHTDPHAGNLGETCSSCHDTSSFEIDERRFDHSATRYRLEGRHAAVACASCHGEGAQRKSKPPLQRCDGCHAEAHGAQEFSIVAPDCNACHDLDGFRPSTLTVDDHARTTFPLTGSHRDVACGDCHSSDATSAHGSAGVNFQPPAQCDACHQSVHGPLAEQGGAKGCDGCHDVNQWKPSLFLLADHQDTAFPLRSSHRTVACAKCHTSGIDTTSFASSDATKVPLSGLDTRCAACHTDVHSGRFATAGCGDCHSERGFRPSTIDPARHEQFSFRLVGSHRVTPCTQCHGELAEDPPYLFGDRREQCADCHDDPHRAQFAARTDGACDACHDERDFTAVPQFDHEADSAFRLGEAHRAVPCAACHKPDPDGVVIYRPLPMLCQDCHGPASWEGS